MTFKYCPDCGSECKKTNFKTYECINCGHKFYDELAVTAGGLIKNPEGKYLFIIRNVEPWIGTLAVPGGYADNDETLEACFKRESFEETGVRITNIKYFSSYPVTSKVAGQTETSIAAYFTAETRDAGQSDNKEVVKMFWLTKEEIDLEKIVSPRVKSFVQDFLKIV